MASTLTLQSFLNLASTHADLLPLSGVGGYTNEPGLSICQDSLSEIINDENDWIFNSVELCSPQSLALGTALPLVTCTNKQDYLFAGASAFVLGVNSQGVSTGVPSSGASIGLASNSAITVTSGTVTVTTLEPHRFAVGNTVYLVGVTMTTGTTSKYNSTFTDNGNQTAWSGGWVITAVTSTSFSFAATSGQNNSDVGGAPGITNFGWLTGGTKLELNNNSSPMNIRPLKARRELPAWRLCADPDEVSVQKDFGTGVLLIRLMYVPSTAIWLVNLIYQASVVILTSLTQTFSPVPDMYNAMLRQAVLYRMYRYLNSPVAQAEYAKLQTEIAKAHGRDQATESNVYLEPEESLVDYGPYWVGM